MRIIRLVMFIALSVIFLTEIGYCQTTDSKNAAEDVKAQQPVQDKTNITEAKDKAVPKIPTPKPVSNKPSDVPDVPLTNARIAYDYTSFDFGLVPGGAQITHHFPVHNTGPDTLIITSIKAG